jgi:drug/metabolite transporter (DMT)-like permease
MPTSKTAPSHSLLFLSLMVLAMVSWGGSWVTAKWAAGYPPEVTAVWRFFLSALSFLPILWWRKESLALPRKLWLWVGLSAASLAVYNLLFLTAMQHGPGGYGGVLVPTLNPQFSFLIAVIVLHQPLGRRALVGLALGLAGGVLQILGPHFELAAFLRPENLLLVGAALAYAVLTQFSAVAQKDLSVFRYTFWTSLLCTVFLAPFAWTSTPGPLALGALGFDFWIDTVYLALVAGTFGTTLYFEAARRVGGARASSFAFLVPVSALVLAFLFLGEVPAWTSVVGGGLSVAAVMVIQRRGTSTPR